MALEEKIENEFKTAMKARDAIKVSTLRMLKSDINKTRLDQNKKKMTDGDIIKIIQRQVKQHKDSIEQFKNGKREDLVEKETKELNILLTYLPEQMPEEEVKKIVTAVIAELGASSKKDMGKVMKAVMEKTKGRAEGKTISNIVSSLLT